MRMTSIESMKNDVNGAFWIVLFICEKRYIYFMLSFDELVLNCGTDDSCFFLYI
jgi:hypothetical protein